jgi:hypothetical protein
VFAGDAFYLPSSGSAPILLFAYTQGGSFVVGDSSVGAIATSIGEVVSFWGADWAETNALSGGPAPSAFKGFANNPLLPQVGISWTSFTGDSDPPPATVPLYTAMIVATTVNKAGPVVFGDDVHIIIVKTGPGYLPDPGHLDTGVIAGVLQ